MNLSFLFRELDQNAFKQRFADTDKCLQMIAEEKWKDGYVCRKCGNTNYCPGKTPYSKRCTRCKSDESVTANTIFHHCRIPLTDAFEIAYMVCGSPKISSYELSRRLETRQMTCWKFKKRIMECLEQGTGLYLYDFPRQIEIQEAENPETISR
jgi:hypothetical protein